MPYKKVYKSNFFTRIEYHLEDNFSSSLHREDGPAIEYIDGANKGHKLWFFNDHLHREDGPAYESNATCMWYKHGIIHREGGPAIKGIGHPTEWFINGKRHREDGPAIEYPNGRKEWYKYDRLHREDGPAIENCAPFEGPKIYFLDGEKYSSKEYWQEIDKRERFGDFV